MLKRIHKIQNIGKFADCHPPGCEFGFTTVLFGSNTRGKSTFTAILRSLQSGNNNILVARKTFGATGSKKVEMDFLENSNTERYVFSNKKWNKNYTEILVFDTRFIAENVFEGEKITFDTQKKLSTIIVGADGKKIGEEIATLQSRSDELTKKKADMTRDFVRKFGPFDFECFKNLKKDDELNKHVEKNSKEILFEKEKEAIKSIVTGGLIRLRSIDFSFRTILEKNLETKQEEISIHIERHFSSAKNSESFLKQGLEFMKDEENQFCVFCAQEIGQSAKNLLRLYGDYFKSGYKELQESVVQSASIFKRISLESALRKILASINEKKLDLKFTEEDIEICNDLVSKFEFEIEEKKKDLNYNVNFDSLEKLELKIQDLISVLQIFENEKLGDKPTKTLTQLETEKKELEILKERFSQSWIDFVDESKKTDQEAEVVRKERDRKRQELDEYAIKMFAMHKDSVNSLCKDMGADFEIVDFKPLKKITGKSEKIFAIQFFNQHKVEINEDNDSVPNLGNSLSESDKRVLAFAFFVSLLKHDVNLSDKIIVFDDPMSSFDADRRRKTVHILADISCSISDQTGIKNLVPKQKIILTHDVEFAKRIQREISDAVCLKIEEYVDEGNKRSKIQYCDFKKEFGEDEILDKIERLTKIKDERRFSEQFDNDCRIVLENIFKRKYLKYLKDAIDKKKSIRTFTETLKTNSKGGFDDDVKYKKLLRLCTDLNIELHDSDVKSTNGDRESVLRDFFDCLEVV